jgi:phospholipid/cholesterol/gamma-HCH transport system substrate-binding protein
MRDENPFRAGVFILICLVALIIGIFTLGKERRLFTRQSEFVTSFSDVSGLAQGAPVRIGGINAGRVTSIGFTEDIENKRVHVELKVDNKFLDRIREDSVASIETQGLLGDKYIGISAGSKGLPILKEGQTLQSRDSADIGNLISKAQTIVENVTKVSVSLADTLGELDKSTFTNLADGAKGFASIADQIKNGDGLAHRIFYSKEDADKIMANLGQSTESLNNILNEVKSGDGFLHSVIYDKTDKGLFKNLAATAEALGESAQLISEVANEIKTGNGLLNNLIYEDSPDLTNVLNDTVLKLNSSAESIKKASEALANGNGTIGALLIDSDLYDNLVEVTDGAKRSFILRQAIRSSLERAQPKISEP